MSTILKTIFTGAILIFIIGCEKKEKVLSPEDIQFEPMVRITSPLTGSYYAQGDTITFRGKARDIEDVDSLLSVQWISDKDGVFNTDHPDSAGCFSVQIDTLSYNRHTISLKVKDSDGNVGVDSILVYNNLPPRVTLYQPEKGHNSVYLTWSKSNAPDFASYKIYRSETSGQGLNGDLIAVIETVGDTTFQDTNVTLGVLYYYQIFVFNTSNLSNGSNETAIEISNVSVRFSFEVTDAVMHPTEPYLYLTHKYGNALYVVNYETETVIDSMFFNYMTESLEIHDTGSRIELYVALLVQEHSSIWWEEDQEGYIAIIDADLFILTGTIHINTDPYDIVAGRDGYLYIPSGSGQWTDFKSYSRDSFQEAGTDQIRQRSEAKLHPIDNKIYTMDTDLSPRDIEVYLINNGEFTGNYDSPYHGTYSMGHPFKICPTGQYLITSRGTIFRCSSSQSEDITYIGSLSEPFRDIVFDEFGLRFYTSTSKNQINIYDYNSFSSLGTVNTEGVGKFLFLRNDILVAVVEPFQPNANYVNGIELIPIQ